MKKFFAVFLILSFTFNSFGLLLFDLVEIQVCKIRSELDDHYDPRIDNYIEFTSDQKDIEVLNGKEIRANGKMYDIIKKEFRNGRIKYFAVCDLREDSYVENAASLIKNNLDLYPNSLPVKNFYDNVLKFPNYNKNFASQLRNKIMQCSLINIAVYVSLYKSPTINIFSPPPNL